MASRTTSVVFVVAIALTAEASALRAQSTGARPVFRTSVDLVTLEVCVKDAAGRPVGGLRAADFLVLDDGRPQRVAMVLPPESLAIEAILLIDRSGSMRGEKIAHAKQAAVAFVDALGSRDRIGVLAFNQRAVWLVPPWSESAEARRKIQTLEASGQTGLLEAVYVAVHTLERMREPGGLASQQVLIVLSDGEDTSSRLDLAEVLKATRESGVILYAVSTRTDRDGRPLAVPYELAQLAFDTGGRTFTPRGRTLASAYQEIARELQHLYRLAYVPDPELADGQWHQVDVRLRHRDAVVRTRSGYYAPKESSRPGEPRAEIPREGGATR